MEKIKKLSIAGTIICIISLIIYACGSGYIYYEMSGAAFEFAESSVDKIDDLDPNSPSAGYEALIYLAGGAAGFLGGILIFLLIYFLAFLAVYQIPEIISGIVAYRKYKKGLETEKLLNSFKTDGFIKAIMNGIVVFIVALLIIGELKNADSSFISDTAIELLLVWNFIAVFALSVYQIKNVLNEEKTLKDKSDIIIENTEENA